MNPFGKKNMRIHMTIFSKVARISRIIIGIPYNPYKPMSTHC